MSELTEHTRQVITAMYAAEKAGDTESLFAVIDDDVVIREPSFLPYGGVYSGSADVQRLFGVVAQTYDLSSMQVDRIAADGVHAFAFIRLSTADGRGEVDMVEVSTLRNGLVVEIAVYMHDAGSLIA